MIPSRDLKQIAADLRKLGQSLRYRIWRNIAIAFLLGTVILLMARPPLANHPNPNAASFTGDLSTGPMKIAAGRFNCTASLLHSPNSLHMLCYTDGTQILSADYTLGPAPASSYSTHLTREGDTVGWTLTRGSGASYDSWQITANGKVRVGVF